MSINPFETFATVDLGSNSFHLMVARVTEGRVQIVDRIKDMVRLAAGLDDNNILVPSVMERAINCLRRFGQRLSGIPQQNVRIVGTNTLRKARNRDFFIKLAEDALGHPIDIIAGREEARLIYLGVSYNIEAAPETRRLVADIGGGSTELILGLNFDPQLMESLHMGCVSYSQRFFKQGIISENRMRSAEMSALQEMEPIVSEYLTRGWDVAIGASGTILSVQEVVATLGWGDQEISANNLRKLRQMIINAGNIENLGLAGLQNERAPVFPGGLAILTAIFEALKISKMQVATGALREGVLYDLLGRIQHEDVRETTINHLSRHYQINAEQAQRVALTAVEFFQQVAFDWKLDKDDFRQLLRWAALLHEIGLAISHSQYQKHGAYLVEHMDMPGFTQREQAWLSVLIRGHRRKFAWDEFKRLGDGADNARLLSLILRLAVVMHRSHSAEPLPPIILECSERTLKMRFPEEWLIDHPLTVADLNAEADYLKQAGFKLRFK